MPLLKEFEYHAPADLTQVLSLLDRPQALLLAGGTIVLNTLKKTSRYPTDVVSLRRIEGLHGIREEKERVRIGAMATLAQVAVSPVIRDSYPALSRACAQAGTTPLRNRATVGGNIASRFFWVDLPAVLMALEAVLELETASGPQKVSVEQFYQRDPAAKSILAGIELPKPAPQSFYHRHTRSMPVDVPSAALAFAAFSAKGAVKGARCVVNTAVSRPHACLKAQAYFEDRKIPALDPAQARAALDEDLKATKLDAYRAHLLGLDIEEICARLKRP